MSEREYPKLKHEADEPNAFCRVAQNLALGPELAQRGIDHERFKEQPPGTMASEAVATAYGGVGDKAYGGGGWQSFLDWLSNKKAAQERVAEQLQEEKVKACSDKVAANK